MGENFSNPRPEAGQGALRLSDFDYALPAGRIADEPVRPRDASRLLVVDRKTRRWTDSAFGNLATHLEESDLLVLNNTRVLKARLLGTLERTGRRVEILFANPISRHSWEVMLGPGRRIRQGDPITLEGGIRLEVGNRKDHGLRELRVIQSDRSIRDVLDEQGHLPLPPYIERPDRIEDETDYQTVYGTQTGAIAAPTAGLHFSDKIFRSLRERGIETVELTLHVGVGTFIPVRTEDPARHRLKPERFEISEQAADALDRAHREGRRVIAVGTTTTRTLEYVFREHGRFVAVSGETDLYILPGFRFRAVHGLLTNFHLPRSTLLLLVAGFASRDLVLDVYRHAIDTGYRFYSYGDCTLFL